MNYPVAFTQYCSTLGLKLTSLRKEVLFILWHAQKPLKAYEILNHLLIKKPNSKPPTVYRALLFFVHHGVAHKIESIQSFTLCCDPEKEIDSEIVMVCNHCYQTIERPNKILWSFALELAAENGFQLKQDIIELKGICHACQ